MQSPIFRARENCGKQLSRQEKMNYIILFRRKGESLEVQKIPRNDGKGSAGSSSSSQTGPSSSQLTGLTEAQDREVEKEGGKSVGVKDQQGKECMVHARLRYTMHVYHAPLALLVSNPS